MIVKQISMKTTTLIFKSIFLLSAFFLPLNLVAQDEIGDFFKGSQEDASKLTQAYISPFLTGFGIGLNSGWHNTAKAKSPLRFDLRITASGVLVPTSDRFFDVSKLNLSELELTDPSKPTTPTIAGPDQQGTEIRVKGKPGSEYHLPNGLNVKTVPAPQVQLTIGVPKNIDLSFRYSPKINIDNKVNFDLIGVGAKVEILPLILGKKEKIVPVDVAVAVGYTQLNINVPLEVGDTPDPNQQIKTTLKGLSTEAIVSKKLSVFTPFFSLGYNQSNSEIKAMGTYEFDVPVSIDHPTGKQTYIDPFSFKQTDVSGMRASLGFQLNLAFFRLYASYTMAKYSYANAGIGFGIGK